MANAEFVLIPDRITYLAYHDKAFEIQFRSEHEATEFISHQEKPHEWTLMYWVR